MRQAKRLAFAASMAALSNILSIAPFTIPVQAGPFPTEIHFTQLCIFVSGILAGPWAGLLTGTVGGLYMSFTKIPFIIAGLAIWDFLQDYSLKSLDLYSQEFSLGVFKRLMFLSQTMFGLPPSSIESTCCLGCT